MLHKYRTRPADACNPTHSLPASISRSVQRWHTARRTHTGPQDLASHHTTSCMGYVYPASSSASIVNVHCKSPHLVYSASVVSHNDVHISSLSSCLLSTHPICDGYVANYSCRITALPNRSIRVDQEIIPTASTQVHAVSILLGPATGIIFGVLDAEYFIYTHRPIETTNLR